MNVLKLSSILLLALSLTVPCRVSADLGSLLKNVSSAVKTEVADVVSDAIGGKEQVRPSALRGDAAAPQTGAANGTANILRDDADLSDDFSDEEDAQPVKPENPVPNLGARFAKSDSNQSPSGKEADAQLVKVRAKGIGMTITDAKMAGGRAAIEQVVGMLVDSETLVENDQLVQDRILTYSGAYLDDIKIVGEPKKSPEGLYAVEVEAEVRKTKLAKKLEIERITKTKVNGGKLFGNLASRRQEMAGAEAMVAKEFEHFPYRFVKAETAKKADGSPDIDIVNADKGTVIAKQKIYIDKEAYSEWTAGLCEKLKHIATETVEETWSIGSTSYSGGSRSYYIDGRFQGSLDVFREDPTMAMAAMRELAPESSPAFNTTFPWPVKVGDDGFSLAIVHGLRAKAKAVKVSVFHFKGDNWKKIYDNLWLKMTPVCECEVSMFAGDNIIGSGRTMFDNFTMLCPMVDGCFFRNVVIAPAFFRGCDNYRNFYDAGYTPSVSCPVILGNFDEEELQEADRLEAKMKFYGFDPQRAEPPRIDMVNEIILLKDE